MYFKGIVMGLKNKYAIVMTDSGEIIRINIKNGLNIGDSILFLKEDIYNEKNINNKFKDSKWVVSLISVAIITIVFITTSINKNINETSNNEYAILTIDINPSIELKIDKDKKIIEVNGLNDDSVKLKVNDLIGLNINAGTILLKEMILDNDDIVNKHCILVGFTLLNDIEDEQFECDVQDIIENNFEDFNVVYLNSTEEELNNAKSREISLGRYSINERLKDKILEEDLKNINIPKLIELFENYLNQDNEVCKVEILEYINKEIEEDTNEDKLNKEDLIEKENIEYKENIEEKNLINKPLESNDEDNKNKIYLNKDEEVDNDFNIENDNKNKPGNDENNNEDDSLKEEDDDDEDEDDDYDKDMDDDINDD